MKGLSRLIKTIVPINIRTRVIKELDSILGINFSGWGMRTTHDVPWNSIGNECFLQANSYVKKHFEFSGDDGVKLSDIDRLLWRHWIVSYCVRHAIKFTEKHADMVECGVCDGLTAFFALNELQHNPSIRYVQMHLYDAWSPMLKEHLLEDEAPLIGKYPNISVARVKKNLNKFLNRIIFHPGHIPESLHVKPSSPKKISYLSIDLNSAKATVAVLEYFFPKLVKGGIILFDDYGWLDFHSTKEAVDKFFANKQGILMPLPTGQAIYYR